CVVEHGEHAERALVVEERRGDDAVRHVAGRGGALAREARVVRQVVHHERLPCHEGEAGDARARREPRPHERVPSLARDRLEHELVRVLVVEEDRRRLRTEDRARDVDDGLEERPVRLLVAAEHSGRGRFASLLAHPAPSVFDAVRRSTVFTWYGVSSGCLASTRAEMAATCGAAKLFPVQRSVAPPSQATSTSTPRANTSTGGSGLANHASGSRRSWLPTEITDE